MTDPSSDARLTTRLSSLFDRIRAQLDDRPLLRSLWLPALAFLGAVAALWPQVTAPLDFQACLLSTDDSFYYYSFARNLAMGVGPTVDGITPTNGVQPLWAGLLTVVALGVRDPHAFVTAALLLNLAALVAAGALWSRIAWRLGGRWFAWITAVVFARALVTHQWALLTGMEIGVNLLVAGGLMLALVDLHDHGWRRPALGPLGLGLLLALFLLGRLDHVLLLAGPVALEVGLRCTGRAGLLPAVRWREALLIAAPVVVVLGPYLLWNWLTFGHWLPVSGAIKLQLGKSYFVREGIDTTGEGIVHAWRTAWWFLARPVGYVLRSLGGPRSCEQQGVACLVGVLLLTLVLVPSPRRRVAATIVGMALSSLLLRGFVYGYRLGLDDLKYSVWYLTLAWPVGILLVSYVIWRLLALWPQKRRRDLIVTLALIALCVTFFHRKHRSAVWAVVHGDLSWREPMAKVDALRWAEANLPRDAVIASPNSGIMHFYARDRKVLNVDGRVDDGGRLRALQAGGSTLSYIQGRGVTHLINTVWDNELWRDLLDRGDILYERPYGRGGERRMVVLRMPPAPAP